MAEGFIPRLNFDKDDIHFGGLPLIENIEEKIKKLEETDEYEDKPILLTENEENDNCDTLELNNNKPLLRLCGTGGMNIAECMKKGTPLVKKIQEAASRREVFRILTDSLQDNNAASKVFAYLMNNIAAASFDDYKVFSADNPFKGRNQSYLMSALYSVREDKLAPSDALMKIFKMAPKTANAFDSSLTEIMPEITRQFGQEGILDGARNYFTETFGNGISDRDVLREISSSASAGKITELIKAGKIKEAGDLCRLELDKRLKSAENMQEVYDNLILYYGRDNAYKILEKTMHSDLTIDEKGVVSVSQKSIDGAQSITLPLEKILIYNKDNALSVSKIEGLDIEGIKDYRLQDKSRIYSFITKGGRDTEENRNDFALVSDVYSKWAEAVSSGDAFEQCETPDNAFLLITGKTLENASAADIKKFNEYYSEDKAPLLFTEKSGARHFYKLNIQAKSDKSGFDISYQEYEKEHAEYIPQGSPRNTIPDYIDADGVNIFQYANKRIAEKLRREKVNSFCTNPGNYEKLNTCIEKYADFAANNEEIKKNYAKLMNKNASWLKNGNAAKDIAEYIRNPKNITEESKKFIPYVYELSKQNLSGKSDIKGMVSRYCAEMAEWPSNLERRAALAFIGASFLPGAPAGTLSAAAMTSGLLTESTVNLTNKLTNNQNYKDDNYEQLIKDTLLKAGIKAGYMYISGAAGSLSEKFTNVLKNNGIIGGLIETLAVKVSSEALIETAIGMPYTMLVKNLRGGKYSFNEELLENFIYDGLPYMRSWKNLAGAMQKGAADTGSIIKPDGAKLRYEPIGGENSGIVKITQIETIWEHTADGGIKPVQKEISKIAVNDEKNGSFTVINTDNPLKSYSIQTDEEGNIKPVKYSSAEEVKYAFRQILHDISLAGKTAAADIEQAIEKFAGDYYTVSRGERAMKELLSNLEFKYGGLKFSSDTKALLIKQAGNADYIGGVSRFNDVSLKKLDDLVQTDDDLKIFKYMLLHKRFNSANTPYEFSDGDMIRVLQSEKIKKLFLQQLEEGQTLSKLDLEKMFPEFKTEIAGENLKKTRNLSYETQELELKGINNEAELNKALLSSAEFKAEIMRKIPSGEAGIINGRLYCNDGEKFFELKMKKETFERLFPISERYNTKQGALGDCWLVSSLGAMMDSPKGRCYLYRLFQENQDGSIAVKFPDADSSAVFKKGCANKLSPVSFYLDGLKPGMNLGTPGLNGCEGLKMIEEAFAVYLKRDGDVNVNDIFFMGKDMRELDSGNNKFALMLIAGRENIEIESIRCTSLFYEYGILCESILERLNKALQDPDKIITFGTKDKISNPQYDLEGGHAYRITGINLDNETITISNPWHDSELKNIPMYELLNYINFLEISKLK